MMFPDIVALNQKEETEVFDEEEEEEKKDM